MNGHDVVWAKPPALLDRAATRILAGPRDTVQKPVILRFNHDAFMQEFFGVLQTAPERLRDYEVRRETWRGFTPSPAVDPIKPPSLVLQRLGIVKPRARGPAMTTAAP